MRRPPPALALAAPVVAVDDVFITRLADLAAASVPSRVPVRPATLKVAAAAARVAVIAAGGAYAADQLTAPAPSHHVPPAGEPTDQDGPSPTSRSSDRTPAPSGAHEHGPGTSPPRPLPPASTAPGRAGRPTGTVMERVTARPTSTRATTRTRAWNTGHGEGHSEGDGDEGEHGRKGHGTAPGNGQGNGQGTGIDQGLGLGNDVVPDPPVSGD